jgi:hypothetical protein
MGMVTPIDTRRTDDRADIILGQHAGFPLELFDSYGMPCPRISKR